ncbi:MAG: PAS domain-containing protein [Hyphomicrobiaceae bacterium]|nr:PAS domain-containing protein [Hyphomicrobiaceae bacterium]
MHTALQALYTYWNETRAQRIAPRRLDIEPAALGASLAYTFMLERGEFDLFQYRLAGTRVCDAFGGDLRGRDFLAGFSDQDRQTLKRDLRSLCEQGAVLKTAIVATSDITHALEIETILLPLMHSGNLIDRVIGAAAPRTLPHWLGREKLTRLKLLSREVVWPDGRPHAAVAAGSSPPPFVRDMGPVRVVRSNRRTFRVLQGGRTD